LPKVNIDRPSAAFFGAVAMIVFGVVTFNEAIKAIDFNTIGLLLGMMILISVLELDGFFSLIAQKAMTWSKTPVQLLYVVVMVTGISSAFLVNDAVVLLFTPVIIRICTKGNLNPIPYLIGEILASNIGSAMTMTGNPQNMLIGMNAGMEYGKFMACLFPVSIIGLFLIIWIIKKVYKKDFQRNEHITFEGNDFAFHYSSMKYSVPIFLMVIVLFFFSRYLNLSIPVIALMGGSLVLIFGKIRPSIVIKEIDWVLLLFFASLFIVVYSVEKAGFLQHVYEIIKIEPNLNGITLIHGLSLIVSQIVSNVPFTIIMLPMLKSLSSDLLWLSIASGSTLAGNATIIGAMANLIVIELAAKSGIKITFMEFLKTGLLVTLLSSFISIGILFLEMQLNI
jgi:Na+/H+ antiporter NhaD/arsenite permease-like protein